MKFTFKIVSVDPGLVDTYVNPDNADTMQIEWKEMEGQRFKRAYLDQNVILSGSEYTMIYDILRNNQCSKFNFYIYDNCTGEEVIFYQALFTYFNISYVNEDRCSLEFSVTPNDAYTNFLNIWRDETNILNTNLVIGGESTVVNPVITCNMDVIYETEEITWTAFVVICQADSHQAIIPIYPAVWDNTSMADFFPMTDDFQLSYSDAERYSIAEYQNYIIANPATPVAFMNSGGTGNPFAAWLMINTRRREMLYIPEVNGTWINPPVVVPAWTFRGNQIISGNNNRVYSRPYTYSTGEESGGISSSPHFHTFWRLVSNTDILFNNCRRLRHVINYMLLEKGYSAHTSQFFYDQHNPISGQSGYKLRDLLIGHKSDFIYNNDLGSLPSDPATRAIWSLEECLNTIRDIFNVYWYFDGNVLRLEHEIYFDNGLTYSDVSPIIESYTVNNIYLSESNKYSIDFSKFKGREKFVWNEADGVDFIGVPIKYLDCVPDLNSFNEISVMDVTTDIVHVYNGDTNGLITPDGLVLLQCSWTNNATPNWHVENELGIIAPTKTYANGHLAWAMLQERYWKPGVRLLKNGEVNGQLTTFSRINKLKIKEEISFPLCCQYFNPYKLIQLNSGQIAKWVEAKFDLHSETLYLTLAYDV